MRQDLHVDTGPVHIGNAPLANFCEVGKALCHLLTRGIQGPEVIALGADFRIDMAAAVMLFEGDELHLTLSGFAGRQDILDSNRQFAATYSRRVKYRISNCGIHACNADTG
jgi:hypothetical protein